MIDISKLSYRITCIAPSGSQLDVTSIVSNAGWEEGAKELAARISLRVHNAKYEGKYLSEIIQPGTPIFIHYDAGGISGEAVRGTVERWEPVFSNRQTSLDITAYDMMNALRHHQDDEHFREEESACDNIIRTVLGKCGVPLDYRGPSTVLGKTDFKRKYISDMVTEALKEAKKKGSGIYLARAKEGVVQIIQRGMNSPVYHFDESTNAEVIKDSFDASKIVTRVVVVGKEDEDGKPRIEATLDGKTQYGVRQVIYQMPKDSSLGEATATAQEMLKEKGDLERRTTLSAPDLPFLRKGDRIHVRAGTADGYFFVKSVRHNAEDRKMTLEIDEDKGGGAAVSSAISDESSDIGDEA